MLEAYEIINTGATLIMLASLALALNDKLEALIPFSATLIGLFMSMMIWAIV